MGFYRLQKQIRQQENVTCAKQIENSQLSQVLQIIHVQKSKEVQSHPEACFHRDESLLFRQVESKEEEKKSHLVGRALGRDRKGVKNSKLGRAVKHDDGGGVG